VLLHVFEKLDLRFFRLVNCVKSINLKMTKMLGVQERQYAASESIFTEAVALTEFAGNVLEALPFLR
jgi:hypothetical protein